MTHEEYQQASYYWVNKDKYNDKVPTAQLKKAMEVFIHENHTLALATGANGFVRCTPMEYTFHDGAFWMFTEGGRKFIGLEDNKNVSMCIYAQYQAIGKVKGMQILGVADMIEPFSDEYNKAAEYAKIQTKKIKKMDTQMYLIKVSPKEIEYMSSDFVEQGFSSRQKLYFQ